jgi:integrase
MHYLGITILRTGPSYRACLPKPRGQGRARFQSRDLDTVKTWIRRNLEAAAESGQIIDSAAAADYRAAVAALPPGMSLLDAVRQAAQATTPAATATLAVARDEYLASLAAGGRRPATIQSAAWCLRRLRPHDARPVAAIRPPDVAAALAHYTSPITRDNARRGLSTFFDWAQKLGYCASNPTAAIHRVSADRPLPELYTPAQAAAILKQAEEAFPQAIPYLAITFFSGVRSSAVPHLRPADIDAAAGQILVRPQGDKLRRSYYTAITPTLATWLKAYPPADPIVPYSSFYFNRQLKRKVYSPLDFPRIHNGARHSFASYLLALTPDAPAVAMQLGHFRETATLFAHYRRLADPKTAARYFQAKPHLATTCPPKTQPIAPQRQPTA